MADNNKLSVSIQTYLKSGAVQERLEALLDKRANQFTTSLISVVNSNLLLQECEPKSVLTAAMTAASLDLPINQNLSFAFIIPYRNGRTKQYEAQFQIGYKGFIQLAQRSGYYRTINATDVREGEIKKHDHLSGDIEFEWVEDEKEREKLPVIGYASFFRLHNGFEKTTYMSTEKLKAHAKKYSQSYKKGYGLWVDNFDSMAVKTVLKLLISKYGPMSTQMQEAILADQAAVDEDSFKYVDNDKTIVESIKIEPPQKDESQE